MFTRHVSARLARYVDGDLTPPETLAVDAHLAACSRCRRELDDIRYAAGLVRRLAGVTAPPSVWNGIEAALLQPERAAVRSFGLQWAFACALLLALGAGGYWWMRGAAAPWEVEIAGGARRMAQGDLVETDPATRARIRIGEIGTVDVEPGSRVQLGELSPTMHRLALHRGTIHAQVTAPPRLFIVDTPISRVVDLGCAYTVTVDEDGASVLRMTEGWVALESNGRESLVPAGAIVRTRRGTGPGMPYFEDAPEVLKQAVDTFDRGADAQAVDVILRESRVRDTLTLWHLLSRVDAAGRPRVFDRMTALVSPPAAVTRERALNLDPDTLRLFREELAWHW